MSYVKKKVSIAVLDYNRQKEANILLDSLAQNAKFDYDLVYVSNGGEQDYVWDFYKNGRINTLILQKEGEGCGIGTRRAFQSCMTDYVIYVQVDQFLAFPVGEDFVDSCIGYLKSDPKCFCIDLAGNQNQGKFSERAAIFEREKYLSIPGINNVIGGPGPYSNYEWGESFINNHLQSNGLYFATSKNTHIFGDNGKRSVRHYPCGGITLHYADEKTLFIIKPLKQKYDFHNLMLTESEWEEVFSGKWPKEGKIPEYWKDKSFKAWS